VPYESELAEDRAAAGQAVASGHSSPTNAPLYFVCVQSVYVDANDRLWVLDSASPNFAGVLTEGGGAKLVQIDLASNRTVRVYTFDADAAPYNSYLNDVRIDTATQTAFITDSNLGAIVVLDLVTAKARRLLADDPSTKANPNRAPMINGRDWRTSDGGGVPQIHSDGIALDPKTGTLYWQSLTNDRLYAIDSRLLTSRTAPLWQINNSARCLGTTCVADGMLCDPTGDVYFTALEMNAVVRLHASDARQAFKEGRTLDLTRSLRTVVQDPRLGWPDSLAIGPAGPTGPIAAADGADTPARPGGTWLYITTSQIDRMSRFNSNPPPPPTSPAGDQPAEGPGYALWRVKLP
jgi:sugar lactone lactonase YvrE